MRDPLMSVDIWALARAKVAEREKKREERADDDGDSMFQPIHYSHGILDNRYGCLFA